MSTKITIDPITRISGFLSISVEIDKNKIINAECSGTLFRGFEKMLRGRNPLDAIYFTQRICGICSTAHSMSSSLALEDALNVTPSYNGKILRDIMHGCEFLQNHIRHFYLYTLPDFVKCSNISPLYPTEEIDFRIPEDLSKKIGENYAKSFEFSKMAHDMLALLGGKAPHNHGIFVGGATVNVDSYKIVQLKSMLSYIKNFVSNNMLNDFNIVAQYYNDYFKNGVGYKNLMSYGVYDSYNEENLTYVKPGVLINGDFQNFMPHEISENIHYSWYDNNTNNILPGSSPLESNLSKKQGYSFIKSPRYNGYPMEVGPLARMILSKNYPIQISTMDRTKARVLESIKIANILDGLIDKLTLGSCGQKIYEIPTKAFGRGLIDTTRGCLGHWISIVNKKIDTYDIITPTAWNLSPKDSKGGYGPIEKSLIGTYISDEKNPIEIGRIVRSFDPCVSCATHVITNNYSSKNIQIV
ncbi:nickel-dependent hydrogenase large subunit [Haloimpatiens sp. FM7330]|uniref:nickel-dependent hydrogenase large subunit n=1 Tax=Haloimpatiens sp. FM7330 TaxID=3298610 RepID=UPI0036409C4E